MACRSTCSIGWPNPKSTPNDRAATSSARRTVPGPGPPATTTQRTLALGTLVASRRAHAHRTGTLDLSEVPQFPPRCGSDGYAHTLDGATTRHLKRGTRNG